METVPNAKFLKMTTQPVKKLVLSLAVPTIASMFSVFFGVDKVTNGTEAMSADRKMFDKMFRFMLPRGVYLPPSAMEVNFMSLAHSDEDVEKLQERFKLFFGSVKE